MAHITVSVAQIQQVLRTVSLQVEPFHIDVMGHMNVGHYGMLFARAARDATSQLGVTEAFIQRTQQGAFMLKHFTQYIDEARLGESLTVYVRVVGHNAKRVHYQMFMLNETRHTLTCVNEVNTTFADLIQRTSAPFPAEIITRMDALIAEHNRLDWTHAPLCGILNLSE